MNLRLLNWRFISGIVMKIFIDITNKPTFYFFWILI